MKKIKENKNPFFSKFLEAQEVDKTKELKGGSWGAVTYKYPSDNDEPWRP